MIVQDAVRNIILINVRIERKRVGIKKFGRND